MKALEPILSAARPNQQVASITQATDYLIVNSRQVDLEPSVAGVDRARSYTFWVRFSNLSVGISPRVFTLSDNLNAAQQVNCFLISQDNQSATTNQKLRFIIFTDNTNYIYIQSENIVLKNRWIHVAITYTGSEANTGLNMYLNGTLEASPTRFTNGTYTGARNNAAIRFKIGHEIATAGFIGNVARMGVWNKALSGTEVTEMYNQGRMIDNADLSFYADIVADWPLKTNANCLNDATFNFSESGTPQYIAREFSPSSQMISFKRVEPGNTRYVSFGGLIRASADVVSWYGRSGTTHLANGKIVRIDFTLSTFSASAPVDVITDGTYDLRGGSVGIDDNGHIHVFSSRRDSGSDTFIDTGKYTSTDGGDTFSAIDAFATVETRYNFYGQHTRGFASGEFFVPFFEHDGTNFLVSLFKTTDNWATHSKITVYSGTTQLGEAALLNVGNNTMIIHMRRINSPYGILQSVSTDGGNTWSAPALTNLVSALATGSNDEMILGDNGKLYAVCMDRSAPYLLLSRDNKVADVIADPTAYITSTGFHYRLNESYESDTLEILGYPNVINIGGGNVLVTWSAEMGPATATRADLFFGMGSL